MKAALIRTGSVSPRACISRSHSFSGVLCCENTASSRKYALHFEINCLTNRGIRRAVSVSDINVIHSGIEFSGGSNRLGRFGSRSFPAKIPEEEYQPEVDVSDEDYPFSSITLGLTGALPESGTPVEEIDFPDGGCGKGCKSGDGGDFGFNLFNGSSFDDRSKIGAYYREMLKSNPNDSLLLRNYGKFLHEVEKDTVRAEECYGRAILASPGDGDLLSLYGKLIWETQRDEDRAKSYFDQAVSASPDDCMVLGSYAHFMWEAEEDNEKEINNKTQISTMSNLVPAF